ncbi:Gfo/Idh/MocA family protein [Pedobacter endophyticus]|uniref:Gfo/Idh/MocA family oxidoreductase n=1 Tax=Pedobacter endophyticus TaxID=2789740 RepID=A0A7S9KZX3_9SPHI|nr:Gfo/Idh/MocA family oxidoreductase [Pedobacter endophyticus]QPH39943.1 Gfo/Idh/MocA family oxidoreductase [Pedobacter endophyticus]
MIKVALVGAGKMGVSHLSILGAHPDVEIVGVCDTSKIVTDFLSRYSKMECFSNFQKMLDKITPDAIFVAVPTKFHYEIIKYAIEKNIHVFAEKPFCLNTAQGEELVKLAAKHRIINQVGYHNKFVGTFKEVKRLINSGVIGDVYHFLAESYGPVVTKAKQSSWRSNPDDGGGCLMDYASHVIDLVNDIISPITEVKGATLKSIYSQTVEDAVYAVLETSSKVSGILSVNWSDETYRKMSTTVTIMGTKGKIISDANELKVFVKEDKTGGYTKGWNVKYITDLTDQVNFNLRGEEYSAQVDYFIDAVMKRKPNTINTFENAWETDKAIALIKKHK